MKITHLTPEQAERIGAVIADVLGYVREIVAQLCAVVRAALEGFRQLVETWRRSPAAAAAVAGPSRPAWMSPYGPPARRHRH